MKTITLFRFLFLENPVEKTKHFLKLITFCIMLLFGQLSFAQLYQLECTTGFGSPFFGPMSSTANPNAASRTANIYFASDLETIIGQELTAIYFKVFRKKPFRLNTRLLCGLSKIVK